MMLVFMLTCLSNFFVFSEACPRGVGAVLVHLTTTAHSGVSAAAAAESLAQAVMLLCQSAKAKELWHVSFALPLGEVSGKSGCGGIASGEGSVRGAVVLGRLPYSCDPYPVAEQAQAGFEQVFPKAPYFVQTDEEREEAARARGEGDEEAEALDNAIEEGERLEAAREQKLAGLLSRISQLEDKDSSSHQRIQRLEAKMRE